MCSGQETARTASAEGAAGLYTGKPSASGAGGGREGNELRKRNLCLLLCLFVLLTGCGGSRAEEKRDDGEIDIDLTTYSATMIYSEVSHMMSDPSYYVGKTIKVKGIFSSYKEKSTGERKYSCFVPDAAACCVTGLPFVPRDTCVFPDDFPGRDGDFVIVGTFDMVKEGSGEYGFLRDTEIVER